MDYWLNYNWHGKTETYAPVPLCPPQIPAALSLGCDQRTVVHINVATVTAYTPGSRFRSYIIYSRIRTLFLLYFNQCPVMKLRVMSDKT
jgi:hypothetical protein